MAPPPLPPEDTRRVSAPATVNEALLSAGIRRAILLERLKAGEVRQVLSFLDREVLPAVLAALARAVEGAGGMPLNARVRRLGALQQELRVLIEGGFGKVAEASRQRIEAMGLDEAEWIEKAVRRAMPIAVSLVAPPVGVLRSALASDGPTGGPLGQAWSEWWKGLGARSQEQAMRQVRLGLASGDSIARIVSAVRAGPWRGTRRDAEAVVRTSVAQATQGARSEFTKANTNLITGERWVSTLDTRTTETCMALDGKRFEVGQGIRPPAHVNCRSVVVPIVKSFRELGIDLNEPPPLNRAAREYPGGLGKALRGEVPGSVTYGEWLRAQPAAVQDEALGGAKARLFRAGRVPIDRFVDQNHRPLSLAELRKLDAKANAAS